MMSNTELDEELEKIKHIINPNPLRSIRGPWRPLFFDVKGRQLRITEVIPNDNYLDIRLNHPITVDTPTPVLFKAGADVALLHEVIEDGFRLKFLGGPKYNVKDGESIHIRDESLIVGGEQFTELELQKIEKVKKAGFKNYYLSYVECQKDVDEFISLVGDDCTINLKIENKKGLAYVEKEFVKRANVNLVAARGDLYVELEKPHEILKAVKTIIQHDYNAIVGSRILLSTITDAVPSCADFTELAWLYDIGYRNMMLCDELCLKEPLLSRAINAFDCFRNEYGIPLTPSKKKSIFEWWMK
jgi:pyruvate kinase